MSSPSRSAGKLSAREICILALMGTLIFATKFALASIPNVNLNSVLIILTVVFFGWKALYSVGIYVMLEGLIFGFGVWWFSYIFVWPILVIAAMLLRKNDSAVIWAVLAGAYGLCFGPLMYIPYFFINGGWEMYLAMWINGIAFDVTHCVSNFVLTLILFRPLYKVMSALLRSGTPGKTP